MPDEPGKSFLPSVDVEEDRLFIQFAHDLSKSDIAYIVEASPDLTDWSEVLYDSKAEPRENTHEAEIRIYDSALSSDVEGSRFLRLKIEKE